MNSSSNESIGPVGPLKRNLSEMRQQNEHLHNHITLTHGQSQRRTERKRKIRKTLLEWRDTLIEFSNMRGRFKLGLHVVIDDDV